MNPAAILALLGELYESSAAAQQQIAALQQALAEVTAERDALRGEADATVQSEQ